MEFSTKKSEKKDLKFFINLKYFFLAIFNVQNLTNLGQRF